MGVKRWCAWPPVSGSIRVLARSVLIAARASALELEQKWHPQGRSNHVPQRQRIFAIRDAINHWTEERDGAVLKGECWNTEHVEFFHRGLCIVDDFVFRRRVGESVGRQSARKASRFEATS